jgi:murein DD-endopeptidase MepM/ murein hydrolase activator NlpD
MDVGLKNRARILSLGLVLLAGIWGCAGSQSNSGFYYKVKSGDNLYRIGKRFGVPTEVLVRVNRIEDITTLEVGSRLWIPRRRTGSPRSKAASSGVNSAELRRKVREDLRRTAKLEFAWPIPGAGLTSRFGTRDGQPHEGIDLGARKGTAIRAAESGKVIHAGPLGDYGKVVILKHTGHYRTVYAHSRRVMVRKGQFVERGDRIAEVGMTGRTTGPHLHFEIRRNDVAKDPLLYVP